MDNLKFNEIPTKDRKIMAIKDRFKGRQLIERIVFTNQGMFVSTCMAGIEFYRLCQ